MRYSHKQHPRPASREKRMRLINEVFAVGYTDNGLVAKGVSEAIREFGQEWLTDEQVEDIAMLAAKSARNSQKWRIRSRKSFQAEKAARRKMEETP